MTEMQPTEIELTGKKKKPASISKRKIAAVALGILLLILAIALTTMLASRASKSPEVIQPVALPAATAKPAK